MVSKSKAKRLAKRAGVELPTSISDMNPTALITGGIPQKLVSNTEKPASVNPLTADPSTSVHVKRYNDLFENLTQTNKEAITATGVLESSTNSPDISIGKFSVSIHSNILVDETTLTINRKKRYGLVGINGSGKSSIMYALGARLVPLPPKLTTYYLDKEAEATDKTPLQYVLDILSEERDKLNEKLTDTSVPDDEMELVYSRLEELDPDMAETRVGKILHGLGFDKVMQQNKMTKEFSGGWKMRIALAVGMALIPDLLLLDCPTAHLDLEAVVYLEGYLQQYPKSLLLVSHSQDFLNNVCTTIMHLNNKQLNYYGGNFDTFIQTKENMEVNQMKQYRYEQEQIKSMKEYIARFGNSHAKLARQAKSKEKTLKKMQEKGLTSKVEDEKKLFFRFPQTQELPPPIISVENVAFQYPKSDINPNPKPIFENIKIFSVGSGDRVCLVGKNGEGKSTLLKIICGELTPNSGTVRRNAHVRLGWFHQHLSDLLDPNMTPIDFIFKEFKEELKLENSSEGIQKIRSSLGKFGITKTRQTSPMGILSEGLKARVLFSWLALKNPHVLVLDEPSNTLSHDAIDALAEAIAAFNGAVILVSHDFRLISQVGSDLAIYEVGNGTVQRFNGDIWRYKEKIRSEYEQDQ